VQEPHELPAPAITPSLPTAENNEIKRPVSSLLHFGQAMAASASAIDRSASKHAPQSEHLYSYSGIAFTSRPIVPPFALTVKPHNYAIKSSPRPTSANVASTRSSCSSVWVAM